MRCRAIGLLLEGDVEERLSHLKLLICLWIWRVRDVAEVIGNDYHVVHRMGEAQHARSPGAVVIVVRGSLQMLHVLLAPLKLDAVRCRGQLVGPRVKMAMGWV